MEPSQRHISYRPLRTPKAAAFAGLVFAVLQIASYWLMQSSLPADHSMKKHWSNLPSICVWA